MRNTCGSLFRCVSASLGSSAHTTLCSSWITRPGVPTTHINSPSWFRLGARGARARVADAPSGGWDEWVLSHDEQRLITYNSNPRP